MAFVMRLLLVGIAVLVGVIAGGSAAILARRSGKTTTIAAAWCGTAFATAVGLTLAIEQALVE